MKLTFSHIVTAGIMMIALAGAVHVYALGGPGSSTAPSQSNIYAPVNNSQEPQTKKGSFLSGAGFGAGFYQVSNFGIPPTYSDRSLLSNNGGISSENGIVSPWGFFTFGIMNSNKAYIKVGSSDDDSGVLPSIAQSRLTGSVVDLDLVGRGTGSNSEAGTQAISVVTGISGNSCSSYATIRTNASAVKFSQMDSSDTIIDHADVVARGIQLKGGSPAKDSVLVSIDAQGRATWAKATVVGGQIQLTPNAPSPVASWDGTYN